MRHWNLKTLFISCHKFIKNIMETKMRPASKAQGTPTSAKDAVGGRLAVLPACCTHEERNKGDTWVAGRHSRPENSVEVKRVYPWRE
jgi:hypothetical protein